MPFWKNDLVWNKTKKKKESKPEDNAGKYFSDYIRLRDCLRTTGTYEMLSCVTCHSFKAIKDSDAGHYISRTRGAVKYHPKNVHGQCKTCNRYQQGKWIEYREFMLEFYGKEETEHLEVFSNALEEKWIDWEKRAETYRGYIRSLKTAFKLSSQFERRETVSKLMKEGTLEEFLQQIPSFIKNPQKRKKDLENQKEAV